MEIWELVVRESVRDVVARYNAFGDSGRMDELIGLFSEDAVMDMGGDALTGRDAIRQGFLDAGRSFVAFAKRASLPRDLPVLRHYTATHVIDATSPTTATCRSYYATFMAKGPDHWGSYTDELAEIDGRWQITSRQVTVDGATPGGMGAETLAGQGRGGF
jgi:hypothetical protein